MRARKKAVCHLPGRTEKDTAALLSVNALAALRCHRLLFREVAIGKLAVVLFMEIQEGDEGGNQRLEVDF